MIIAKDICIIRQNIFFNTLALNIHKNMYLYDTDLDNKCSFIHLQPATYPFNNLFKFW